MSRARITPRDGQDGAGTSTHSPPADRRLAGHPGAPAAGRGLTSCFRVRIANTRRLANLPRRTPSEGTLPGWPRLPGGRFLINLRISIARGCRGSRCAGASRPAGPARGGRGSLWRFGPGQGRVSPVYPARMTGLKRGVIPPGRVLTKGFCKVPLPCDIPVLYRLTPGAAAVRLAGPLFGC
jgi:hypothetical protein